MAKTNAQRQAEYRERHLKDMDGVGERLNLVINLHAKRALERLAVCYAVTQQAMLEILLRNAENEALNRALKLPNGSSDYYDGLLRLDVDSVTQ